MRIVHVVTDLDVGGAEMVLYRLLRETRAPESEVHVVSLRGDGEVGRMIRELGVSVHPLDIGPGVRQLAGIRRMKELLRGLKPSLVQTWMYHSDLIGGLAARRLRIPVVWGVHAGPPPGGLKGVWMRVALRSFGVLSRFIPTRIVCCSQESLDVHRRFGYRVRKMKVVPNGFEPATADRASARSWIMKELNVPQAESIIIRVGRFHPQKDYPTMLDAFRRVLESGITAHLVLVGEGLDPTNAFFHGVLRDPAVGRRIHLLGPRKDVFRLVGGSDVAVSSSSFGEALPLVLGEAMSVGTPVVATDVGDALPLIGDQQRVTPRGDPRALATALVRVLSLGPTERDELGESDRRRVMELYSIGSMVRGYLDLYRKILEA